MVPLTTGLKPNTPAPLIQTYLKDTYGFVCPTRQRGFTYTTAGGSFDPSITGFLSYGFNDIGCFQKANLQTFVDTGAAEFKASLCPRPAQLLAVTEVSGDNNPLDCDGNPGAPVTAPPYDVGDAAWLDGEWGTYSGPTEPVIGFNSRLQTAYGRHNLDVNVLYVDGHIEFTLPSRLTWGVFMGVYADDPNITYYHPWNASISTPALDRQVWSSSQE
jgi:prepilin-type processing-associated H-X9-DG protein